MSLDLNSTSQQIQNMSKNISARETDRLKRIETAVAAANDFDLKSYEIVRQNLAELGRTTTSIKDSPSKTFFTPDLPKNIIVAAVDGSHIDVDRHLAAQCFLINIGSCLIKYGDDPYAELATRPTLYATDENMVIKSADNRTQKIQGSVLGIKRHIEELKELAKLINDIPKETPSCLFLDGTLFPVGMSIFPQFVRDQFYDDIKETMTFLLTESSHRKMSVAAYISYPSHSDIVESLRMLICDDIAGTGICGGCVEGVKDRDIFYKLLGPDQRSPVFVRKTTPGHNNIACDIGFFYVKAGNEIVRIEMPYWSVEDNDIIELTHGTSLDQSKRGPGYPTVLIEAHEQAIVTTADRESFVELVELSLNANGLSTPTSQKNISKRLRNI
ncbi:MAG: hypothetical protein CL904_00650 [Dehalococcoidia bacterium]|nr:hypothetical protein [Dehalococcoidia bacterium]MQG16354.1 DNA double-strand break repair nuclease NurA [SAR202 cluster bacterium]